MDGREQDLPGSIAVVEEDGVPVLRLCGEIDSLRVTSTSDLFAVTA